MTSALFTLGRYMLLLVLTAVVTGVFTGFRGSTFIWVNLLLL